MKGTEKEKTAADRLILNAAAFFVYTSGAIAGCEQRINS